MGIEQRRNQQPSFDSYTHKRPGQEGTWHEPSWQNGHHIVKFQTPRTLVVRHPEISSNNAIKGLAALRRTFWGLRQRSGWFRLRPGDFQCLPRGIPLGELLFPGFESAPARRFVQGLFFSPAPEAGGQTLQRRRNRMPLLPAAPHIPASSPICCQAPRVGCVASEVVPEYSPRWLRRFVNLQLSPARASDGLPGKDRLKSPDQNDDLGGGSHVSPSFTSLGCCFRACCAPVHPLQVPSTE